MASAAVPARRLPTSLRRRVTASSPICWSAIAERTAPEAEYICPAGFLRGWPVGVELVAGQPEKRGSQQRHFLQASKDVFLCSVLIYVQRIRASTTMRDINRRFTYLLAYLLPLLRNCAKFLPFYPSKFSIQIRYTFFSLFRIKLLFGTPSKLLSKTRLIRDIYLAIQTYLLWTLRP